MFDLGSTHGTWLNKEKLRPRVYYRLRIGQMVKFGGSSRQFVLQVCVVVDVYFCLLVVLHVVVLVNAYSCMCCNVLLLSTMYVQYFSTHFHQRKFPYFSFPIM